MSKVVLHFEAPITTIIILLADQITVIEELNEFLTSIYIYYANAWSQIHLCTPEGGGGGSCSLGTDIFAWVYK